MLQLRQILLALTSQLVELLLLLSGEKKQFISRVNKVTLVVLVSNATASVMVHRKDVLQPLFRRVLFA